MSEPSNTTSAKETLFGFGWSLIGTAIQSVLHVAILVVLARVLSPLDFGVVSSVLLIVTFVKIICRLGITQAIVQRPNLETGHIGAGFATCMTLGVLGSLALLGLFGILRLSESSAVMANTLLWFTPMPLVFGVGAVPEGLIQRNLKFRSLALADIISYAFGYGLVGITLALNHTGFGALIAAYWVQLMIRTLLLYRSARTRLANQFSHRHLGELMHHGGWQTVAAFFNYGAMEGDKLAITSMLGMGPLGMYGRAYQLAILPAATLGMITEKVAFPTFSKQQRDVEFLRDAYLRGTQLLLCLFLPFTVFEVLAAEPLVRLILGPKWLSIVPVFKILALSGFFRAAYRYCESFARADGAVLSRAWCHGIYGLTVVSLSFLGSSWGLEGVAIGVVMAIAIHYFLVSQLTLKILRLSTIEYLNVHRTGVSRGILYSVPIAVISQVVEPARYGQLFALTVLGTVAGITFVCLLHREFRTFRPARQVDELKTTKNTSQSPSDDMRATRSQASLLTKTHTTSFPN